MKVLLRMYKEEELHLLRSGRSTGYGTVNRFDRGYRRTEGIKMAEYLERSAEYAHILRDMEKIRNGDHGSESMNVDRDSMAPSPVPTHQPRPRAPQPAVQRLYPNPVVHRPHKIPPRHWHIHRLAPARMLLV
jgi:hypothetical protein